MYSTQTIVLNLTLKEYIYSCTLSCPNVWSWTSCQLWSPLTGLSFITWCLFCQSDIERHTLAKYLMELTLLDYDMVHYRPSEIAAAALCLSQLLLEGLPWVSGLDPLTGTSWALWSLRLSVSPVSHAAALLHLRGVPPEADHASHRKKCRDGERGEDEVPGELQLRHDGLRDVYIFKKIYVFVP